MGMRPGGEIDQQNVIIHKAYSINHAGGRLRTHRLRVDPFAEIALRIKVLQAKVAFHLTSLVGPTSWISNGTHVFSDLLLARIPCS